MKDILKRITPDVAAIAAFVIATFAYFATPTIEGLSLSGHDNTAGIGAGHERIVYNEAHDEPTYWTNALFGGMPTYQIAPSYPTTRVLAKAQDALTLWLPQLLTYVLLMLLGFYIMLRCFGLKPWIASLGAVMWAMSSYFFIIIGAGHLWKAYALAYLPAVIGGVVLCLRGRLVPGAIITALATALEVYSNHVQMTYYFIPVIAVVVTIKALNILKTLKTLNNLNNPLKNLLLRCGVALAAGLIGIAINTTNLYHTYEYAKHTMREKSELTSDKHVDAANQTKSGLERDYITAWSYGIDETWSLLVPKINGGSSMDALSADKVAMSKANTMYSPVYGSLRQYFGDQPFTAGPVYVGAIVLMLAILALMICRGPLTWGLLCLTLLSIGLSWGHNMMWLTDLFLDYVPMYDKFRTVSSILVVAEFCIPLLAVLALKALKDLNSLNNLKPLKPILIATFITAGAATLIALMPDVFVTRFVSNQEMAMLQQAAEAGYIPQDMLGGIIANLTEMRQAVVSSDAWRSVAFIVLAAAVLLLYIYNKVSDKALYATLMVLCVADMWTVNKRYLNDGMFSRPVNIEASFAPTETDRIILSDKALDYRVLNMAADIFNENKTSYLHKSVGGYHAAKMRRYQELIEHYIQPQTNPAYEAVVQTGGDLARLGKPDSLIAEDSFADMSNLNTDAARGFDVLNMLNTRWLIIPLQENMTAPVPNPFAFGNAWFVDCIAAANNADEEMAFLGEVDLRTTAVIAKNDLNTLNSLNNLKSPNHLIALTDYQPNALTYKVSGDGGLAVLSEIYYPGWHATLEDGTELPIVRANYVLRAVNLPAGDHTLTLRFDPQSIHTTESIAWLAWSLLLALIVLKGLKTLNNLNSLNSLNNLKK